jgi:diadenosine tetraphosphatase ApaH/serine/threonine PP2A family protein phosphatase
MGSKPVPTAIISDIHSNAEALRAVLADIKTKDVDRIICLGDIIGYGPDPLECLDMVQEHCEWALMGNHDFGVLYEPTNFNAPAASAAYWTRDQLDAEPDDEKRARRYDFLGQLRVRVVETAPDSDISMLFVHGSPRRPINEYIFPDDVVGDPDKLGSIFRRVETMVAVGHTHQPGVFTDEPDFYPPGEMTDETYSFEQGEKAIINVGSVGQPRDGDVRASYVVMHPDKFEFFRVEYDIAKTAEEIKAIPALSDRLGERLYEGR